MNRIIKKLATDRHPGRAAAGVDTVGLGEAAGDAHGLVMRFRCNTKPRLDITQGDHPQPPRSHKLNQRRGFRPKRASFVRC